MSGRIPLSVTDLCFQIGKERRLSQVNFDVHEREFISLMGENGVGKTTLIEALLGYQKIDSGKVLFWGQKLERVDPNWFFSRVAFVPSRPERYPSGATVRDLIASVEFIYPTWNQELSRQLLKEFKIQETQVLNSMSLGESSKVRLIKALAFEPEILLLDELTANLSPKSKDAVTAILIDLFATKNMAIVYVCHSLTEALSLSDRVLILESTGLSERV